MDDDAQALRNDAAYAAWAADYPPLPHNPLMRAEQAAMLALLPTSLRGLRALDLACGTGRYGRLLAEQGAEVVGVDACLAMLARAELPRRVHADMGSLPFADASFELLVSGLAVGHAPDLDAWWREAARVLAPGGLLLLSDFHPEAARAGMKRSFTDATGSHHELLHSLFDEAAHERAAARAGMRVQTLRRLRVGHELKERFEGADEFYARWAGLPVVLALAACKRTENA
jgi:malonyl-CoA O-methyltransferase